MAPPVAPPVATAGSMAAPVATAGSMGSNTCECADGTFTCACTGTSMIEHVPAATAGSMAPPVAPPVATAGSMAAPVATAGSMGSNTCECADHTFTCACTGMK